MSKELPHIPHARNWRDIPQPVKPRAMSNSGRRRFLSNGMRFAAAAAIVGSVGWAAWQVTTTLRRDLHGMPSVAKSVPVKEVVLVTDGVLDREWIVRTLALPKTASLMSLDLQKLRQQVLASGQVQTATLTLSYPDTLAVTISERSPVARIMAEVGQTPKELLVARDGTVFEGVDFDPVMIQTLPWLHGFSLVRRGANFTPIAGMDAVAELLAKAKLEAEHLYETWEVVSLARLSTDGEIEVRSREGTQIIFGTREDYFRQLARLDLLLDTAAKAQPPGKQIGTINLAIGAHVPVSWVDAAPLERERRNTAAVPLKPAITQPISPVSSNSQIKIKLEL